jgi:hypothetical protein
MQVGIYFFGTLENLVGRGSDRLKLPEHAISDVFIHYERLFPRLGEVNGRVACFHSSELEEGQRQRTGVSALHDVGRAQSLICAGGVGLLHEAAGVGDQVGNFEGFHQTGHAFPL